MNAITNLLNTLLGQVKEGDPIAKGIRLLFIVLLLGGYLDLAGLQEIVSESGSLADTLRHLGSDGLLALTALTSTNSKQAV